MQRIARFNFDKIAFILLVALTLFLAFYNLDGFPSFESYDEGYRLQLPKNLVQHGRWAALTDEGFIPFGADSTGPVVMLPIALSFQLFGINLWNARLVMAVYFIFSVITLYFCVRYLYNSKVALLACLLYFFVSPEWLNPISIGRQVYGEVPSLAFVFLGAHLWFRSLENDDLRLLLTGSICFGLAATAKEFIVFGLVGSLSLVFLIDFIRSRRPRLRPFLVPILISLGMLVIWLILRNAVDIPDSNRTPLAIQLRTRLFPFQPHLIYESIKFLGQKGYLLWGIPALAYSFILALSSENSKTTIRQLFFPCFVLVWMGWYAIASIGWVRYAFPGSVISSILLAKFLFDMILKFQPARLSTSRDTFAQRFQWSLAFVPPLLFVTILIFWPALNVIRQITINDNQAPQALSDYIIANVPDSATILSTEWEIAFLSNRLYLHIPWEAIERHIRNEMGWTESVEIFNINNYDPDYVITGPTNKKDENGWLIQIDYLTHQTLVASFGDYDLYEVTTSN